MKRILMLAPIALLCACGTTGIVKLEENRYMVSVTSPTIGFREASEEKAKCYKQANEHCKSLGKEVKTVNMESRGSGFARPAKATLEFECVQKSQKAKE